MMLPVLVSAQKLNEACIDDQMNMAVSMNAETGDYTNLTMNFTYKSVDKFVTKVKKYAEIVRKWSKKAHDNGVRNFRQSIPGTINYDHLSFDYDGVNCTSTGYFLVPSFDITDKGDCFLLLRGYYKGSNVTPYELAKKSGDKYRYQELSEFNLYLRVNADDIDKWVGSVEQMAEHVKESQSILERTKKMFR